MLHPDRVGVVAFMYAASLAMKSTAGVALHGRCSRAEAGRGQAGDGAVGLGDGACGHRAC
ncbi:MAG: hypothetical protein ACLSGS_11030 [Adlercreutzia sp.]